MFKHIVFLAFLAACGPYCHAAQQPEEKKEKVKEIATLDYTLKCSNEDVDNSIESFKKLKKDFEDYLKILTTMAQHDHMLMCVALGSEPVKKQNIGNVINTAAPQSEGSNATYSKYVVGGATGLLSKGAHSIAHTLKLHIVQTQPHHIVPMLCNFLQISSEKHVLHVTISKPICTKCHYLLKDIVGYKNQVQYIKNGCQGKAFTWPMPLPAMAYVNGHVVASPKPLEVTEAVLYNLVGIATQSLEAKEQAIAALRKELAVKGNIIANRDKQVESLNQQLARKVQIIANRDSQIVLLRNQLQEKQETLTAKNHTINTLQQKEAAWQKQMAAKDRTINTLQRQIETNGHLINTLKKEKTDVEKSLKESRGLVETILAQKKEVKQKVEEMKEEKVLNDGVQQLAANEALFQQKLKKNKCTGGNWYKENIPKDLAGIRKAYSLMQQGAHKQAALEISHGLATLPDYAGKDFYVKHQYWSCKLYDLQKKVNPNAAKQLVCFLEEDLEYDAKNYCPYHKAGFFGKTNSPLPAPTSTVDKPNWKARLAYAQKGWKHYNAQSNNAYGLHWYKSKVEEEMQGLQQAYPKLQAQQHKKEALDLFIALSKIHRFEHFAFLFEFMKVQNRLLELTGTVGHITKNDIVYTWDTSTWKCLRLDT